MFKVEIENGYYLFKLKKLIQDRNISINKLIRETNTDYKVLNRLLNGETIRIDIFVLARLCDYLNCTVTDIIEYFPNKK